MGSNGEGSALEQPDIEGTAIISFAWVAAADGEIAGYVEQLQTGDPFKAAHPSAITWNEVTRTGTIYSFRPEEPAVCEQLAVWMTSTRHFVEVHRLI